MGRLSLISPDGSFAADVLPASLVAALGMSLAFIPSLGHPLTRPSPHSAIPSLSHPLTQPSPHSAIPSLGTAISAARPEEGGLASGIVDTSYQVGSALGLAAMTAVAAANGAAQLGNLPALTSGFSSAFIGAAAIALVGALLAAATLRSHTSVRTEPATTRR